MPADFKHIKKQFEKSMPEYDENAVVQRLTASKMMIELLKVSDSFENILEIGTGTGLLTKQIAKNLSFKRYCGNDLIEKSKIYVKKYIPDAEFICGNAAKIKTGRKQDLIISNAVLQWFENPSKIIDTFKFNLNKSGILAFSTFTPSNFKEITAITGLTLKYKTKDELAEILNSKGFNILYCEEFYEPVEFKTPLELLAHMKKTGVNSLSDRTWTMKEIKSFCEQYSKRNPKTVLTYSPVIIIAALPE